MPAPTSTRSRRAAAVRADPDLPRLAAGPSERPQRRHRHAGSAEKVAALLEVVRTAWIVVACSADRHQLCSGQVEPIAAPRSVLIAMDSRRCAASRSTVSMTPTLGPARRGPRPNDARQCHDRHFPQSFEYATVSVASRRRAPAVGPRRRRSPTASTLVADGQLRWAGSHSAAADGRRPALRQVAPVSRCARRPPVRAAPCARTPPFAPLRGVGGPAELRLRREWRAAR